MKPQVKAHSIRPVQSHHSHNGRKTDASFSDDFHARVAVLAYSFYERRGREDGHDFEDWIQAEKRIRDEIAPRENRTRARAKS